MDGTLLVGLCTNLLNLKIILNLNSLCLIYQMVNCHEECQDDLELM